MPALRKSSGVLVAPIVAASVCAAAAQAPSTQSSWLLNATFGAATSGGSQDQLSVNGTLNASLTFGARKDQPRSVLQFRGEATHATGKKLDQPTIVTVDNSLLEIRDTVALSNRLAIFGLASRFHQIAFDLDSQYSYAVGVHYDIPHSTGFAIDSDLRHESQDFVHQPDFASWALRFHESYSHSWILDPGTPCSCTFRALAVAQTFEIIPAFEAKAALQRRVSASIALPVTTRVGVTIAGGNDYFRNVSPTFSPNYWKLTCSITYSAAGPR